VEGSAFHASIVTGADFAPEDLAANHHRVDGEAIHPTITPQHLGKIQ